jgi:hypothetical protein
MVICHFLLLLSLSFELPPSGCLFQLPLTPNSYVLIHFLEVSARICLECSREILLSGAIVGYGNTNQDSLFLFNRQQFFQIILYRFLVFARKSA